MPFSMRLPQAMVPTTLPLPTMPTIRPKRSCCACCVGRPGADCPPCFPARQTADMCGRSCAVPVHARDGVPAARAADPRGGPEGRLLLAARPAMAFRMELPDIGEGVVEAEVQQWFVAPGDVVEEDQPLVEVMTDKATVTIPSPRRGRVVRLFCKVGEIAKVHAPDRITGATWGTESRLRFSERRRVTGFPPHRLTSPRAVRRPVLARVVRRGVKTGRERAQQSVQVFQ